MSERLIGGALVQSWTEDARAMVFGGPLGSLKILNTALAPDLVRRFADANPGAPVAYRLVDGDDLAGLDGRVARSLRDTDALASFLGGRLFVEVPVNEAYQSGDDLSRLNDATVRAVATLRGAGRRPITLNFSVGNPQLVGAGVSLFAQRHHAEADLARPAVKRPLHPRLAVVPADGGRRLDVRAGEWARVAEAVQATVDADGALGLHEYAVPGARWLDGWLNGRFARVRDELLALGIRLVKFWIGEHGIDHGVVDGRLGGYRLPDFRLDGEGYGRLLEGSFALYAADRDVLGVSVFLVGAF